MKTAILLTSVVVVVLSAPTTGHTQARMTCEQALRNCERIAGGNNPDCTANYNQAKASGTWPAAYGYPSFACSTGSRGSAGQGAGGSGLPTCRAVLKKCTDAFGVGSAGCARNYKAAVSSGGQWPPYPGMPNGERCSI